MNRTAEIAKTIRSDLKAAFPGVKFSVRTSVFAGGSSIDVAVVSAPVTIHSAEFLAFENANPASHYEGNRWTDDATVFLHAVEAVASRLHEDSSDSQSDYFCCNFYFCYGFARLRLRLRKLRMI